MFFLHRSLFAGHIIPSLARSRTKNETLADNQYKIESGSLKVYLQPAYLETLSAGSHTLTVQFSDGHASAKFEIVQQGSNKNASGGSSGKAKTTTGSAANTANTGDTSRMGLWLALLMLAASGCCIGIYFKKKACKRN